MEEENTYDTYEDIDLEQEGNISYAGIDDSDESFSTQEVILSTVECIVVAVGFVTNIWLVGVITRYRKLRTSSNLLMVCLALSNILILLMVTFTTDSVLRHIWIFGEAGCKAVNTLRWTGKAVNIYIFIIIMVEKIFPFRLLLKCVGFAREYENIGTCLLCVLLWVIALLGSIPNLLYSNYMTIDIASTAICTIHWPSNGVLVPHLSWAVYEFTLLFAFPVVVIIPIEMYLVTSILQRRHLYASARCRFERSVTLAVIAMVTIVLLSNGPFYIFLLLATTESVTEGSVVLLGYNVTSRLPFIGWSFIPIVLPAVSAIYRKVVCLSLKCASEAEVVQAFPAEEDSTEEQEENVRMVYHYTVEVKEG